jgi:hypothetical protein
MVLPIRTRRQRPEAILAPWPMRRLLVLQRSSMIRLAKEAHSTNVRLRLLINGDDLELAQVGDGSCILRDHRPHSASDAQLIVTVAP